MKRLSGFLGVFIIFLASSQANAVGQKEVKPGFSLFDAPGGNSLLVLNEKEAVLVDSGYAKNGDVLLKFLEESKELPKYLINTHWHSDHTGGNIALGNHTIIIGQDNVFNRLSQPQFVKYFGTKTSTYPIKARPAITFAESMTLHAAGKTIQLKYYPDAHTDSDSTVFFVEDNLIHVGDLYFSNMFPFIDADSKGNIRNIIAALKSIVDEINDDTIVIPGHGKVSNKKELKEYILMLEESADIVAAQKKAGKSLAEIQEKGLPEPLLKKWGNGFIKEKGWIQIVYNTL